MDRRNQRWRRLAYLTGLGTAGYLLCFAILVLNEDWLLYRARIRPATDRLPPPSGFSVDDVWLRASDRTQIHGWWHENPSGHGAALYCHGKGTDVSRQGPNMYAIAQYLDMSVLAFDYPGFGQSSGAPSEAGCYAAADAAYDWLVRQVPAERIIIMGQSLGGGVATEIASRRPHRALALLKTFTSFPDVAQAELPIFPFAHRLAHNRFDNLGKVKQCQGPVFIAHGDCDHLIPFSQAERLFQAASQPKRLLCLKGCGHHGDVMPMILPAFVAFLAESETR